jgi:hypothetical protein
VSVKRHGCYGSTLRCNGKACPWKITTGQCTKMAIRAYAKSIGWVRRRTDDLCAACGQLVKKARAVRIVERDAHRQMTPEQRREARNKYDRDRRAAKKLATKETA